MNCSDFLFLPVFVLVHFQNYIHFFYIIQLVGIQLFIIFSSLMYPYILISYFKLFAKSLIDLTLLEYTPGVSLFLLYVLCFVMFVMVLCCVCVCVYHLYLSFYLY